MKMNTAPSMIQSNKTDQSNKDEYLCSKTQNDAIASSFQFTQSSSKMHHRQFRLINNLAKLTSIESSPIYQRNKQHYPDPEPTIKTKSNLPKLYKKARNFGIFTSGENTLQQVMQIQKMQQLISQIKAKRRELHELDSKYESCYLQMLTNENKMQHIDEMIEDTRYEIYLKE